MLLACSMYLKLAEEVADYLELFCFEKWKTELNSMGQMLGSWISLSWGIFMTPFGDDCKNLLE